MSVYPSVKQMVNRSLPGHHTALRKLAADAPLVHDSEPMSAVRGMMTVLGTLRKWGCVETIEGDLHHGRRQYTYVVTDRGRDLLTALDERALRVRRDRVHSGD